MIFVFGSNTAGIHGAGAAKHALRHEGAIWSVGQGHRGNSYALPTKDIYLQTFSLEIIQKYVDIFIKYANRNPELTFKVTRIGCGLAGLTDEVMAPMFQGAPSNCQFDTAWQPYLLDSVTYWGTFE